MLKRLFASENLLNWLLVFVPIALVMEYVLHSSPTAIFVVSALGIIPLAGMMGHATERIAFFFLPAAATPAAGH